MVWTQSMSQICCYEKINDKKRTVLTVRFQLPKNSGVFKKIRLCRTSAKGEPAKSRWVPHLDASNFPLNRPCLSPRINRSRINNVDSVYSRTPYTADLSYYNAFCRLCQRNKGGKFTRFLFLFTTRLRLAKTQRFLFQSSTHTVCRVLQSLNAELRR